MHNNEFIFYNAHDLSIDDKKSMFRDCMEISYEWFVNTLDCTASYSRQSYDCTFEEILSYLKDDSHVVVIDRKLSRTLNEPMHFEIGFSQIISSIDYLLFIKVDREKIPPILEKYQLNPML